jgi:hypothetical protein
MTTLALAHLLACLDRAVKLMDEAMFTVDARVVEAHRAELAAGREWPGQPVKPWIGPDEPRLRLAGEEDWRTGDYGSGGWRDIDGRWHDD